MRRYCHQCGQSWQTNDPRADYCTACRIRYGDNCTGRGADHASINACRVACGMAPLTEAEYRAYRKQAATWNRGRKVEAEA